MNLDWLHLLLRHQHEGWSLQGFGMFRYYLSPAVRLHVWVPRLATEDVSTIHTHPWSFRSEVLVGQINDRTYHPIFADGRARAITHMQQRIVCGPGGCAVGEPQGVHLHLIGERTYRAGQSYEHVHDVPHESIPSPGCITLVSRTFREDTEHADVYYPAGQSWVSAEPRPATYVELDIMRRTALKELEGE